ARSAAGAGVLVRVGEGVYWEAPGSTVPAVGRGRPRWSVVVSPTAPVLSWEGLLAVTARVGQGPPLTARGPSLGSVPVRRVLPLSVTVVLWMRVTLLLPVPALTVAVPFPSQL